MPRVQIQPWRLFLLALVCMCPIITAFGCAPKQTQAPPVVTAPDCPPCSTEEANRLATEKRELANELDASHAKGKELEGRIADLEIRILRKESQIIELQRRAAVRQKRLDNAITEVVRTKAKLRSIESKAEAASTIAEAELAVKAMQGTLGSGSPEKVAAVEKAKDLLNQSIAEFEARNFGGALYLAVQSKDQSGTAGRRIKEGDEKAVMSGETAFGQPLPLKLTKNTNLRAGPGQAHKIRTTLERGTMIVGYAYIADWIRIETAGGETGWVHHSLIMAR